MEWFTQTPMQPTRGKCSGTELPSDIFAEVMSDDKAMIGTSDTDDRDKLANNR